MKNKASTPTSHSTTEAAELLGVSIPTVQRWVDAGRLLAWKTPGGHRRIDAASADALRREMGLGASPAAAPVTATALTAVVVDDNPDDVDLLQAMVEDSLPGVQVRTFESGILALVAIGQHAPDIVITDIVMPGLDGVEVLRQLTALGDARPRLLIAVSSSFDQFGNPRHDIPEGVHFFTKPVNHRSLVTLLKTVFGPDR